MPESPDQFLDTPANPSPQARRIVTYERLDELWEGELETWLARSGGIRVPKAGITVVLAPDPARLGMLKRKWAGAGRGPLFGVYFWGPDRLRRFLLERRTEDMELARRDDLVLAARLAAAGAGEEDPHAVVARDPRAFLAAWDQCEVAAASSDSIAAPWRGLPPRIRTLLSELELTTEPQADWRLAAMAESPQPLIGRLLIDGFSATHAALFPLILAGLRASAESLCTVSLPRARRMEELWLGSLEAACDCGAEAIRVSGNGPEQEPFRQWAEEAEAGRGTGCPTSGAHFRLFSWRRFELQAVAERVEALWLENPDASIAVAIPQEPLLMRGLAAALLERGVPFHDTFGHPAATGAVERVAIAWIRFQRSGQTPAAQALLDEMVSAGILSGRQAQAIEADWSSAREASGSDDLAVLTAYLEKGEVSGEAVAWSRAWPRLPETASMRLYLELARLAFGQLGGERALAKAEGSRWIRREAAIERAQFLEWLLAWIRPPRVREEAARDAFAPVQLLRYEGIRSGIWTHLLLTGLNEGLVPPPDRESAFLVEDAADRHFRTAVVTGAQGEGHQVLRTGMGLMLEGSERRAALVAELLDAIAEAEGTVELFATYAPEGQDRSATVLSELYLRLYRAASGTGTGLPPVEAGIEQALPNLRVPDGFPPIEATREACARRSDPAQPFDAYSFGFSSPPAEPLALGARDWESLVRRPATVWLSGVAGLRSRLDFAEPLAANLQFGLAVHRLLSETEGSEWKDLRKLDWPGNIHRRAERWRHGVEEASRAAGRSVSPLWKQSWGMAVMAARRLAQACIRPGELCWLGSEQWLPKESRIPLEAGLELRLRGRIDAILVDHPEEPRRALIIDFKTGGDRQLSTRKIIEGDGLQLLLYGAAIANRWQIPVGLCLLKPGGTPDPQLELEPGEDPSGLLVQLAEIGRRGVFGFGGAVRSDYQFVGEYPMAFLPPPPEVVEAKWAKTHPGLSLPKGTFA